MRSDRPYRSGWQFEKLVAHIEEDCGTQFDPWAVLLFMRTVNNGRLQEIEERSRSEPASLPELSLIQNRKPAA